MSSALVLSDSDIHDLLIRLSKDNILKFQGELEKAIVEFTVGDEGKYQPTPDFVNRPNGQMTLFRTFSSPDAVGTKIVVSPAPVTDSNGNTVNPQLNGVLTLCDSAGRLRGLLNAAEVTGYRTTLSALIPWMWRRNTEKIVIFGAGKQALWHARLVLALRGSEIRSVTIVNRSATRARSLVKQVTEENQKYWKSSATLDVLDQSQTDYDQRLEILLSAADVVFGTVGSKSPMFSLEAILGKQTRKRPPFVAAIGSWQPDMLELDPAMLRYAAGLNDSDNPKGAVLVDDLEECLAKSGEVIQSGLKADQLMQVGQIINWLNRESEEPSGEREKLQLWLSEGFVVYKGIGVSVTDLAAGNAILALAEEHNIGVAIPNF